MSADRPDRPAEPTRFASADGTGLVGDVSVPTDPWAVAVVCHPHPRYGGNRFHPLVAAIHRALPAIGVASLRFDMRTVFDDGVGERQDTDAAIDEIRRHVTDVPVAVVGYSFGAIMCIGAAPSDCFAVAAVAPPLASFAVADTPACPTLVVAPEFDQFTDPPAARQATADWPDVTVDVVEGADHFLIGHDTDVADRVCDFLEAKRP